MHSSRMITAHLLTVPQHALAGCICGGCTCPGGVPAGGYLRGGVPAWVVPAQGVNQPGGVPTRGCTCPGVTCPGTPPCEQYDRQVAKILPCPKLRLRAVIIVTLVRNANFVFLVISENLEGLHHNRTKCLHCTTGEHGSYVLENVCVVQPLSTTISFG